MSALGLRSIKRVSLTFFFFFFFLIARLIRTPGRFPFNKNFGLKFRKFHLSNGTVHSGCTDSTKAIARLVFVLISRMQKSGTGGNNFGKWKGTFRSDRPSTVVHNCRSDRTERVRSVWFSTEISGILGWMESAPATMACPLGVRINRVPLYFN